VNTRIDVWRAVAGGVEYVAPEPMREGRKWTCARPRGISDPEFGAALTPRGAVVKWAHARGLEWTDVLAPGEWSRESERARCAEHVKEELRAVARHDLGPGAHDALVEVLRRIESGERAG